jgi:hypothetical protein
LWKLRREYKNNFGKCQAIETVRTLGASGQLSEKMFAQKKPVYYIAAVGILSFTIVHQLTTGGSHDVHNR